MKEESLLLLSDLQKLINQVVLIDYTIIILGVGFYEALFCPLSQFVKNIYIITNICSHFEKEVEFLWSRQKLWNR